MRNLVRVPEVARSSDLQQLMAADGRLATVFFSLTVGFELRGWCGLVFRVSFLRFWVFEASRLDKGLSVYVSSFARGGAGSWSTLFLSNFNHRLQAGHDSNQVFCYDRTRGFVLTHVTVKSWRSNSHSKTKPSGPQEGPG